MYAIIMFCTDRAHVEPSKLLIQYKYTVYKCTDVIYFLSVLGYKHHYSYVISLYNVPHNFCSGIHCEWFGGQWTVPSYFHLFKNIFFHVAWGIESTRNVNKGQLSSNFKQHKPDVCMYLHKYWYFSLTLDLNYVRYLISSLNKFLFTE